MDKLLREFRIDTAEVLEHETDIQLSVVLIPSTHELMLRSIESGIYITSRDEYQGVVKYRFKDSLGQEILEYGFQLNNFKYPAHRYNFESYKNEILKDVQEILVTYHFLAVPGAATENAIPEFYTSLQYEPLRY